MNLTNLIRRATGRKERPLTDLLDDAAFWADLRVYATDYMLPVFEAIYLGGVEIALRMVEIAERKHKRGRKAAQDDPALPDRITRRATLEAARQTDAWWNSIEETSRRQLADVLTQSADRQISLGEATDYLEGAFGPVRARRIAVTETNRIVGAAAQDTYEELGIGQWDWRTAADGRVDQVCKDRKAAGPYSMDEKFAPAHVSCRCWPVPHVTDEDEVRTELPADEPAPTAPDEPKPRRPQSVADIKTLASWWSRKDVEKMRLAGDDLLRGKATGGTSVNHGRARKIMQVAVDGPRTERTLWRGMKIHKDLPGLEKWEVGKQLHIPLASASYSKSVTTTFAGTAKGLHPLAKRVVIEIEPGANGVPIEQYSKFPEEREVIISGRFRITHMEERGSLITLRVTQDGSYNMDNIAAKAAQDEAEALIPVPVLDDTPTTQAFQTFRQDKIDARRKGAPRRPVE